MFSLQNTCGVIKPGSVFVVGRRSPPISSLSPSLSASPFFICLPLLSDSAEEPFSRCLLTVQYKEKLDNVTISENVDSRVFFTQFYDPGSAQVMFLLLLCGLIFSIFCLFKLLLLIGIHFQSCMQIFIYADYTFTNYNWLGN